MRRCTVIATCLANSALVPSVHEGELLVREIFEAEYPAGSFFRWNVEIGDQEAAHIMGATGKVSHLNVSKMIRDFG